MVLEGILLNGKPLEVEDDKCYHNGPACNGQSVSPPGVIAPSRLGMLCDFHYDVVFSFYEYVTEAYTLDEYRALREAEPVPER